MLAFWPLSDLRDLRIALAVVAAEVVIGRQVAAPEPGADGDEGALDDARLLGVGRRQIEAQHVTAAVKAAAVENQRAVAVIDAGARLGRRDEPPQQRRDAFRIDREFVTEQRVVARAVALAGLQLQEPVGIDADGVGLDGRGCGDRPGDDLALDEQALHPRIDQAGAELGEIENAENEGEQAGDVEEHDPAREAREALGDEEMPAVARQARDAVLAQDMPGAAEEAARSRAGAGEGIDAAMETIDGVGGGCREKLYELAGTRLRSAGRNAAGADMAFDLFRRPIKHPWFPNPLVPPRQGTLAHRRRSSHRFQDRRDAAAARYSLNRYPTP